MGYRADCGSRVKRAARLLGNSAPRKQPMPAKPGECLLKRVPNRLARAVTNHMRLEWKQD
jgi:hypothetical protein